MEVPHRSVQFLELGEGITLVPVVCEDLARLDEVADLLRAVGPTLVLTLLLDGPQLASRWTARYASVLADDPGSAVLTLTAYGLVERSRPVGKPPSPVVALWKDPARGLREIALESGAHGVLVSVATTEARRRCADGRTPVDNSTGLVVAGVHQVRAVDIAAGPDGAEGVREPPCLQPTELTIVTSWADALAEALEHAPERADEVVADALPGAPWRQALGVAEPSTVLTRALTAMAETVSAADASGDGTGVPAVLTVLRARRIKSDPVASLAAAVLGSVLKARRDRSTQMHLQT